MGKENECKDKKHDYDDGLILVNKSERKRPKTKMEPKLMILSGLLALAVVQTAGEDRPTNLRMDLSELLMEAKDAVRIARLRKQLAEKVLRQRNQVRRETKRDEKKANAAVAEVRSAIEKARQAMESLRKIADTARAASYRQRSPLRAATKEETNTTASKSGELTDPDESNGDIKKLVKKTHENLEKKPDHEIVISKGMTKDVVKNNGQVAKKLVKESEDKKPNGEEIVDKQANLEIDREPGSAEDPEDPEAEGLKAAPESRADESAEPSSAEAMYQIFNIFTVMAFTLVLVV